MSVTAWRIFGLDDDGTLMAPFGPVLWPDAPELLRKWPVLTSIAGCVAGASHAAPAEDCTCGIRGVEDRAILLATANTRAVGTEVGSVSPILADAGVVARVTLAGRVLPGVNMPVDDPPTTWRAEKATLTELHVGPVHAALVDRVTERYGIPVLSYDDETWAAFVGGEGNVPSVRHQRPAAPTGEEAFVAAVRRAGFGIKNLDDPRAPATLLDLGRKACGALRSGVSLNDVLSVLFHTDAAPTFAQAQAFVDAAIANLCPGCFVTMGDDKLKYGEPVRARENSKRQAQQAVLGGLVGPTSHPAGEFGRLGEIGRSLFGPRR